MEARRQQNLTDTVRSAEFGLTTTVVWLHSWLCQILAQSTADSHKNCTVPEGECKQNHHVLSGPTAGQERRPVRLWCFWEKGQADFINVQQILKHIVSVKYILNSAMYSNPSISRSLV